MTVAWWFGRRCWCSLRGVCDVVFVRLGGEVPCFSGESESEGFGGGDWREGNFGKEKSSEEVLLRAVEERSSMGPIW